MKKRPFSKKQIHTLRKVLEDRPRDLSLLNVGVDTALRGADLLSIKVQDVKIIKNRFLQHIQETHIKLKNVSKINENIKSQVIHIEVFRSFVLFMNIPPLLLLLCTYYPFRCYKSYCEIQNN